MHTHIAACIVEVGCALACCFSCELCVVQVTACVRKREEVKKVVLVPEARRRETHALKTRSIKYCSHASSKFFLPTSNVSRSHYWFLRKLFLLHRKIKRVI